MRYSKAKMIMAAVITFVCLIIVGFGIYKGIDYSKRLTEGTDTNNDEKVLATVYKNDNKKKTTKKETKKKTETKKETKKTEEKKTTKKKTTTKKKEEVKVVEKDYDENKEGFYKVVGLKVKNKSYTKQELDKLLNAGYSLKLEINDKGLATIAVLSINKMYEFTDEYFYDGVNEYNYTYSKNKLNITIDDYEIVFEKE